MPRAGQPASAAALAMLALVVAALCALTELLAGPAYRIGALPLGIAIQTMRWAATVALGAAAVALLMLLLSLAAQRPANARAAGRRSRSCWASRGRRAAAVPVHASCSSCRRSTTSPPTPTTRRPSKRCCRCARERAMRSTIRPARRPSSARAIPTSRRCCCRWRRRWRSSARVQAARAMGWDIVASAPERLRLEATDTTLLFGFKDDVVVRITPQAQRQRGRRALAVARGWQRLRHQRQARARLPRAVARQASRSTAIGAAPPAQRCQHLRRLGAVSIHRGRTRLTVVHRRPMRRRCHAACGQCAAPPCPIHAKEPTLATTIRARCRPPTAPMPTA